MENKRSIGNVKSLGNGKYVLRISAGFDDYGKRIQLSRTIEAKSNTDAERQLMKFYNERTKLSQDRISEVPGTLQGLYEEFKQNHIEKLRPNTQEYYTNIWNRYLKSREKAKLKSFSPKMVYDVLNKTKVGDKTKKAIYGMLFTMFKRAVAWGYLDINPCERVTPPKYKAKEKRPYTESELIPIIEAIEKEDIKLKLFFYLAVALGMRRSEMVGLKWSDIDFEKNIISIKRSVGKATGLGTYDNKETKNKKSIRNLNTSDDIINLLKAHKDELEKRKHKLCDKWIEGDWVFTQWNGEIMHVDTSTKMWNDFLTNNPMLAKTNLHSLRHTAATLMIKNNVAISTVSGILGHAQMSTTVNIYAHVIEDAKKEALSIMDGILKAKKQ
ncbi:MAG: hypothetical protein A2Y15_05910 [Clostridiales bacterium GWF2_36_10]|nr:MAG: hypothetical protein A2Y15_05910 [Clostridiales bacterium GWF2_36_10]HAN21608.1 hypothetical protein [Clostridiales bacterium]